ncbi:hypothetical protein GH714_024857 [Hevea brasiliensis]|uniref:Uncharacterized protein n=1 Tax=Hevea brasiliensis TaxID=3981 RepID=A0A6A6ME84_HEVBR|nr:hypothetical protein GH714_024857 [Hevea brasiliensis]
MQNVSVFVDIPLIDQSFYGDEIFKYTEVLKTIGVMFDYGEACEFVGKHLMSIATSSTLTRSNVISVLNFVKFLREKLLSPDKFICSIKKGSWLRTSRGLRSPVGSVLYDQEWRIAEQISDIPFIDKQYYGEGILRFKEELKLLGVIVGFNGSYHLVGEYLRSPLTCLTAEALLLVLDCMRYSGLAEKLVNACRSTRCLKTNLGYKSPAECFWFDPEWGCLLEIFGGFPLIDGNFYGSRISLYKMELKQLGVKVDIEEAVKVFVPTFKGGHHRLPLQPKMYIRYCHATDSLMELTDGPFIDEEFYGFDIQSYKKELSIVGVIVDSEKGCSLLANHLASHSEFAAIVRIYDFLSVYQWKSEDEATGTIWVP